MQRPRCLAALSGDEYVRSSRYLADPTTEAETRLKTCAGPFSDEPHHVYFTIGMYALACGDRQKAAESFG